MGKKDMFGVPYVFGGGRKSGSGSSGRRDNSGGVSGPKTHGGKAGGGPGKNAQHGSGGHHSQTPKGNRG